MLILKTFKKQKCQNNGQCMSSGNGFMCRCQPGYSGQSCEIRDPCTPNPVIIFFINFKLSLFQMFLKIH